MSRANTRDGFPGTRLCDTNLLLRWHLMILSILVALLLLRLLYVDRVQRNVSFVQIATSHILIRWSVSSFPCRNSVTFSCTFLIRICSLIRLTSIAAIVRFVEVLGGVVCRSRKTWPVKVVEHQIHIFAFLHLQVVPNFNVPVYLNFNVGVGLARHSPRLRKPVSHLRISRLSWLWWLLLICITRPVPDHSLNLSASSLSVISCPSFSFLICIWGCTCKVVVNSGCSTIPWQTVLAFVENSVVSACRLLGLLHLTLVIVVLCTTQIPKQIECVGSPAIWSYLICRIKSVPSTFETPTYLHFIKLFASLLMIHDKGRVLLIRIIIRILIILGRATGHPLIECVWLVEPICRRFVSFLARLCLARKSWPKLVQRSNVTFLSNIFGLLLILLHSKTVAVLQCILLFIFGVVEIVCSEG